MCKWLRVSSSGYYEWRRRPQSATAARREKLKQLIVVIFELSDETYGYRRIHASLLRSGHTCSLELVRALVGELGLVTCQPRPWRHSLTDQDPAAGPIPDLLHRDFTASAPGEKMVGDITYSNLGRMGIPRHRDRLLHESGDWLGNVGQLQDSADQCGDRHGGP
jgi:putative transposase